MENHEYATLAGGCFWCTEAVFNRLKGVKSVEPGYSGGLVKNPTYEQVSSGETGHAEVIQIEFDPKIISFSEILDLFWHTHDPTTINRQGNDVGTQYRSAIFYHNDKQKRIAEKIKEKINNNNVYKNQIVTEIVPFTNFYLAEDYHKNYFEKHKDAPYCQFVISPKLEKAKEKYSEKLK